jgi:hypothetical protein
MTGVIAEIGDDDGVPFALVNTALVNTALDNTGAAAPLRACLLACPDAAVGDTVLVHAGYVLRRLARRGAPEPARPPAVAGPEE